MKKVKCYGRKNTNLMETSAAKAFFKNVGPDIMFNRNFITEQKKTSCISESKENLKFNNSEESSLFDYCIEKSINEVKSLKLEGFKKNPVPHKAQFKKFQKYKGKRKCKFFKHPLKTKEKIPRFSSIYEHDLVVELNFENSETLDCCLKDDSVIIGSINFENIIEPLNNETETEKENILPFLSQNLGSDENIIDARLNKFHSPIFSKHMNLKSPSFKRFEFIKDKDNFCQLSSIPITSTPIALSKKFYQKCPNVSNVSAIATNQQKVNDKRKLIFENSFNTQEQVLYELPARSLATTSKDILANQIDKYVQQKLHLSHKSYTNSDKSIYIKSHSSIKEVSTDSIEQPSVLPMLLELCVQHRIMPFRDIYDWKTIILRKIGEGSFGEVFMLTIRKQSVVIKVIPVSEEFGNNLQSMESVYSEIKVLQALSELRSNENFRTKNFNLLKKVHVVQGSYPNKMLGAWDAFSKVKTTYNYRPDIFDDEQIFVILELENGGKDMSSFVLRNGVEAESVFKQIAISLAIAEDTHLFEHRDLHLGNILVQRNKNKKVSYIFRGKPFSISSEGLFVTIIDFTLSRILHDNCVYYNDLADDESLFNQSGDFQFEVYRATKLELKNQWQECLLYSNVLWLTFLCQKLTEHDYCRPSSIKHKKSLQNIKMFAKIIESCENALDCLDVCKILVPIPDKIDGQDSRLSSETLFIDKKSFRKSQLLT